jgi:hypothetical protein
MTLMQILQISEEFLKFEDMRALDYVERRWNEEGCPTERWQVINFLEKMLRELIATGTGYPKVLLLRKKEIQRRTFTLEPCEKGGGLQIRAGDACPECNGRGFLVLPEGRGTLCMTCLGGQSKVGSRVHPCG